MEEWTPENQKEQPGINVGSEAEITDSIFNTGNLNILYGSSRFSIIECQYDDEDLEFDQEGNYYFCPKCGKKYYLWEPNKKLTKYKGIPKERNVDIESYIHNIEHSLFKDKDFNEAFQFAKKFKADFGGISQSWEYLALTYLFVDKKKIKDQNFLRRVLDCLTTAQEIDPKSETYQQITDRIARILYLSQLDTFKKSQVPTVSPITKINTWTKQQRSNTIKCINSFFNCYKISGHPAYLVMIIEELSCPRKWLIKKGEEVREIVEYANYEPQKRLQKAINYLKHSPVKDYRIPDIEPDYHWATKMLQFFINMIMAK